MHIILATLARTQLLSKSDVFPKAKRNLLRTMLTAFVVCSTPEQVVVSMMSHNVSGTFSSELMLKAANVAAIILWVGTCMNPAIYLASHREFQRGAMKLFGIKPKLLSTNPGKQLKGIQPPNHAGPVARLNLEM